MASGRDSKAAGIVLILMGVALIWVYVPAKRYAFDHLGIPATATAVCLIVCIAILLLAGVRRYRAGD